MNNIKPFKGVRKIVPLDFNLERTQSNYISESEVNRDLEKFRIVPSNFSGIEMNNLKYKYDSFSRIPKYNNAKYDSEEYDIETNLTRVKREWIKNPFVLNHK